MKENAICECGHPANQHTGRTRECWHEESETSPICRCKSFRPVQSPGSATTEDLPDTTHETQGDGEARTPICSDCDPSTEHVCRACSAATPEQRAEAYIAKHPHERDFVTKRERQAYLAGYMDGREEGTPLREQIDILSKRCGFPIVEDRVQLMRTIGNLVERLRADGDQLREQLAACQRERAQNVSPEEAHELQSIMRTITNSGRAFITSARELIAVHDSLRAELSSLTSAIDECFDLRRINGQSHAEAIRQVLADLAKAREETNSVRVMASQECNQKQHAWDEAETLRTQLSALELACLAKDEVLNADLLSFTFNRQSPISVKFTYNTGGSMTHGPNNCLEFFALRQAALSLTPVYLASKSSVNPENQS